LEGVWASAWFEGTASQRSSTGLFDCAGASDDLVFVFHGARSAHNADRSSTGFEAEDLDFGSIGFEFAGGHFVGCEDREDFADTGVGLERFDFYFSLVTDGGDHSSFGSSDNVRFEAEFADAIRDVFDEFVRGVLFHDNDHDGGFLCGGIGLYAKNEMSNEVSGL
jgi:hypothetical protein